MIVLQSERQRVERVVFAPDGRGIAVPYNGGVRLWKDLNSPKEFEDYEAREGGLYAQFSPDGTKFFCLSRPLIMWDLVKDEPEELVGWPKQAMLSLTPDGRHLLCSQFRGGTAPFRLSLHPFENPRRADAIWTLDSEDAPGSVLEYVAGERFVLTESLYNFHESRAAYRDTLRSMRTGEVLAERTSNDLAWQATATSPDGATYAGVRMASVFVYAVDAFDKPLTTFSNPNKKHFTDIAFHPGGQYLAATNNDTTVQFYDTKTWKLAKTFTWKIGKMRSIAFSPDGTLAAAGAEKGKVVVWDVDL